MKKVEMKKCKAKLVVSLLAACLLAGNSLKANATDITGVTGNDGVFNIDPTQIHGDTGFRQYENFKLSEGDIANLIFKYGEQNVSKFVNLVDNTININGLVNTMRDGNFYNGHAVFISPNGMVVGASGVLNVGSMSVYTPTTSDYENFKNNPTLGYYKLDQGNADVIINGKVIARDGITLSGNNVNIGSQGALLSGVNNVDLLSSKAQADKLFNELVNASAASNASSFASKDGKIVIKSVNSEGSVNIDGSVKNVAENGQINISNKGSNGLSVAGNVDNNGNTLIVNNNGDLNIGGNIQSKNRINITNHGNALNINGTIKNDNVLKVWNTGNGGTNLNGHIINNKSAVVQNDAGTFKIGGNVENNSSLDLISNGNNMEFTDSARVSNTGALRVWNTGKGGMKVAGEFDNDSRAVIQNYKGNMEISGNISNSDTLNVINNGDKLTVTDTAQISNSGYTGVLNTGANGMDFAGTVQNTSGQTILTNQKGNMTISGTLNNEKGAKLNVTNRGNKLVFADTTAVDNKGNFNVWSTGANGTSVAGSFNGSGDMIIQNDNGDMDVNASFDNQKGNVKIGNKGNALTFGQNSTIKNSGSFSINNVGTSGTTMNGTVNNTDGTMLVANKNGNLSLSGNVQNAGKLSYSSKGGFDVTNSSNIENSGTLTMLNTGSQGMNIKGNITNTGNTILTNKGGNYTISGTLDNQSGKMNVVNQSGKLEIAESAQLKNNGSLGIVNEGQNGVDVKGAVSNSKDATVIVRNESGDFNYSGTLTNNGGKVTVVNNGNGMQFTDSSVVNNDGSLYVTNNSKAGMRLDGVVNSTGNAHITSNAGTIGIGGEINGTDNDLYIISKDGLVLDADAVVKNDGYLSVLNSGANGITVNGMLSNNGRTLITNNNGDVIVNGTISNTGDQINITNHGNGTYVNEQGKITSDGVLKIWSTGEGGLHISGTVENASANSAIQSDNGSMSISGNIINKGDKLYITNNGKDLVIDESAKVQSHGNVAVWNNSDIKADVKGDVTSEQGKVIITNRK